MPYGLGYVLSGGGSRGFAHLGCLHALGEKGIRPDIISGVSAGAIAGAFLSAGIPPKETHAILKKGNLFKYTKVTLPATGLLKLDGLEAVLKRQIPFQKLEELPIPLIVGATNMTDGCMQYFTEGELSRILLASSSIPILFAPVQIDGKMYCDGGILENIPIDPLLGECHRILVSNVSPLHRPVDIKNMVQMVLRTFHVSIHARINVARKHADIYIEPQPLADFDLLSSGHADEAFEIGYQSIQSLSNEQILLLQEACCLKL